MSADTQASADIRPRIGTTFALLIAWNLVAWILALWCWHGEPAALAAAFLAYTFGLRHAVDPDHIAAIDNATRKLIGSSARPHLTGLYFSFGHSTIVVALCILVATGAAELSRTNVYARIGAVLGPALSITFLLLFAFLNLVALRGLIEARKAKAVAPDRIDRLLTDRSLLTRLCRRLFRIVSRPRDLFWIGMLFGLGFDTATEIGLLGLAAANGRPVAAPWTILLLPLLFAAGMALLDTLDSMFMARAYNWALLDPTRKLDYNIAITLASIAIALAVSVVEGVGIVSAHVNIGATFGAFGVFADLHATEIGIGIVGLFVILWAGFVLRSAEAMPAD